MHSVSGAALTLFYFNMRFLGLREQPPPTPHFLLHTLYKWNSERRHFRVHHGKWLILRTFQCNGDFTHSSPRTPHCPALAQRFPRNPEEGRERCSIPSPASPPEPGLRTASPRAPRGPGRTRPDTALLHSPSTPRVRISAGRSSPPTVPI